MGFLNSKAGFDVVLYGDGDDVARCRQTQLPPICLVDCRRAPRLTGEKELPKLPAQQQHHCTIGK